MLARAEPSLDLGIEQVRVALNVGPRCVEESGYLLVRHYLLTPMHASNRLE